MGFDIFDSSPSAALKKRDAITFDPLGVATILPNPRATSSVIRLYTQYPRNSFRWTHFMMVGGSLPPLGVLVEHMLSHNYAIHPAISLVLQTASKMPIRSNTVFQELPLDFSNTWILDICNYKPSTNANNDFLVVNVDPNHVQVEKTLGLLYWFLGRLFTTIGLFTGLILVMEMVFSILLVDIWAAVLFLIYTCHWLATTLVSFSPMIEPRPPSTKIVVDGTPSFAVYERKEGGTIIFKGRQDTFEAWFRQTWQFNQTPWNLVLHWAWIITGSLAALGSTAAMVNMMASLQLGFLGLLLFCSAVELLLSRISRNFELRPYRECTELIGGNSTRTTAIIRSAIEARAECRLDDLDWVQLGLLPKRDAFVDMQALLKTLNTEQAFADEEHCKQLIETYRAQCGDKSPALVNRIADEATASIATRFHAPQTVDEKSIGTVMLSKIVG